MQDFPSIDSKDNTMSSNSNMLSISPPRFPEIDTNPATLIRIPKRELLFIIFLQYKLISLLKYCWKWNLNNTEPIEYKAVK